MVSIVGKANIISRRKNEREVPMFWDQDWGRVWGWGWGWGGNGNRNSNGVPAITGWGGGLRSDGGSGSGGRSHTCAEIFATRVVAIIWRR